MKLSEAIRIGAKKRPQCYGAYFNRDRQDHIYGSCAMGSAYEAYYGSPGVVDMNFFRSFPMFHVLAACPVEGCDIQFGPLVVENVIPHLNDLHRWTREQIANWVEKIEQRTERLKEE